MWRDLTHRPLALAGLAVLCGTLWGIRHGPPKAAALAAAAIGCSITARIVGRARATPLLLGAVAITAGLHGGGRVYEAADVATRMRRDWSARAPPSGLVSELLVIERAGEDPWSERAWVVGRGLSGARLFCTWPGTVPETIGAGVTLRATGRLDFPREPTNPGQRDSAAAWARQGVCARLYVRSSDNLEPQSGSVAAWRIALRCLRRAAARQLRWTLPQEDAAVACALLLGWRSGLSDSDRLRFERTGTMHLLAISGMHLLLVAGLIHACARRLGIGIRGAAACALVCALVYVPIAGAGAPVRRAAVVLTVHGLALARGRMPDAASSLGGALVILLLFDPVEVCRLGFWLSFAAAAAIAALAPSWSALWTERTRLLARFPAVQRDRPVRIRLARYFWSGLAVSLAASAATQPLIAHQFRIVTPLSPFTNLLAAPFITLLMPLVAAHAAGLEAAAPVISFLLESLRVVLDFCARVPGACIPVPPPDEAALGIWMAGLVALRPWPRTGCVILLVATSLAFVPAPQSPPSITLLDVGHGQALLIRDRQGRAVLVDAGSRNRPRVGQRVVLPALREAGVAELAQCVCTHADADHWCGIPYLFGRVRVRELIVGESAPAPLLARARDHEVPTRQPTIGQRLWRGDGVSIDVLDAGRGLHGSNEQSLALVVTIGDHRLLLPADREGDGIERLLAQGLPRCTVLVAPHHGAPLDRPELTLALRDAVRPSWVLASRGRIRPGEHAEAAYGSPHWSTYECGALTLKLNPDGSLALHPAHGNGATIAPE